MLLVVLATLLAACGGSNRARSRRRAPRPAPRAQAAATPAGFPSPSEVTCTGEREIGPSQIVRRPGTVTSGPLSTATKKGSFEATDYSITKEEREDVDAEVSFSGQGVSGQVKLPQSCKDRTDVAITIRPS